MMPLGWGLQEANFKQQLPYCNFYNSTRFDRYVSIKQTEDDTRYKPSLLLYNFPGDCGTLCMGGANDANQLGLQRVKEVASKNGFDTVIATVVKNNTSQLKKLYLSEGWVCVVEQTSNRKDHLVDKLVFVLYINVCEFKGYSG